MAEEFGRTVGHANSSEEVVSKASELFKSGKFRMIALLVQGPGIFDQPIASIAQPISELEHIRAITDVVIREDVLAARFGKVRFRLSLLDVDWLKPIVFPPEGKASTLVVVARIGEDEFLSSKILRRALATMTLRGPSLPER